MQLISPYKVDLSAVEKIRQAVSPWFNTADTRFDEPEPGAFRFRGRIAYDPDYEDGFFEIEKIFAEHDFKAYLRQEGEHIYLLGLPNVVEYVAPMRWGLSIGLFLATLTSTLLVGAFMEPEVANLLNEATTGDEFMRILLLNIWRGWPYAAAIMSILTAHELGHFFAALYHKTPATLPYFIPMPLSGIGTFGAVIIQRGPTRNVRAQFDFGAAGPLFGLIFAIPILIYGLATSDVGPLPEGGGYILEGNSIMYAGLKTIIFGQFLPADNIDVSLNSIAWAGWVGLLITGLNLIPISPFDGGRVLQVIIGEKLMRRLYYPVLGATFLMGFVWSGWFIWAVLFYMMGGRYETPLDTVTPLGNRRQMLAWLTVVLFILLFVPIPLQQF